MTAPTRRQLAHLATYGPCNTCRADIDDWTHNYPLTPPLRIANHSAYDDTPAGIAANRTARYEQWLATIRFQVDLIRRQCAAQHRRSISVVELPPTPVEMGAAA